MSDQKPINIPMEMTLKGSQEVLSAVKELQKAVASLGEMDPSSKLKEQTQALSTATQTLGKSLETFVGGVNKNLKSMVKEGSDVVVGYARETVKKAQAEYEALARAGQVSMEKLAAFNKRGVSFTDADRVRWADAKDLNSMETASTRMAQQLANAASSEEAAQLAFKIKMMKGSAQIEAARLDAAEKEEKASTLRRIKLQMSTLKMSESLAQAAEKAEKDGLAYKIKMQVGSAKIAEAQEAAAAKEEEAARNWRIKMIAGSAKIQETLDEKARKETAAMEAYGNKVAAALAKLSAQRAQAASADRLSAIGAQASVAVNRASQNPEGNFSYITGVRRGLEVSVAPEIQKEADAHKVLTEKVVAGVSATKQLAGEKAKLKEELRDAHSAVRGLASGFNAMWLTWGNLAPLAAGAAVSSAFVQTIKIGAEVQQSLTTLRVLGGESEQSVSRLNAQMLELGRTGPYGPRETAEAMKTLTLAGLKAEEVSSSLRDVLNFSVAGDTGIKEAADTLTTVATAFGLKSDAYAYVGDVIAVAAAESKASVADMSNAFKTASAINQQFGVSLEDTAVGLALLANAGIKGTAAGTSLRNMVSDLSGRTKHAAAALKELGVEAIDPATGKVKSLDVVMSKLLTNLQKTSSASGALKYLQTIFDERGAKEAYAMFEALQTKARDTGREVQSVYDELKDKALNAGGFASIAAAEIALTPLNQMRSVAATLESVLVETFSNIQPYLIETARNLKEIIKSEEFRSAVQSIVESVGSLTAFVVDHAKAIGTVVAAYFGFRSVITVLAEMRLAWLAITAAEGAAAAGAVAVGAATRAATAANPLLLALSAAVTAAAAGWAMYEMWAGKAKETTNDSMTTKGAFLQSLLDEEQRLKNVNAAREQGITLQELEAQAKEGAIRRDQALKVSAAQAKVDSLKSTIANDKRPLVQGAAKAELEKASQELEAAQEMDRILGKAIDRTKGSIITLRRAQDDATRKQMEDEQKRRGALFTGNSKGPADTASGPQDNTLQNIQKKYRNEMSTIEALESDKAKLLQGLRGAKLISDQAFYTAEMQIAEQAERLELAQIEASRKEYEAAYKVREAGITGDKAEEQKKNLARDRETQIEEFANREEKIKSAARTREVLAEYRLQGELKSIRTAAIEYSNSLETDDKRRAQQAGQAAALRRATADQAVVLRAQYDEQSRLNQEIERHDQAIQRLEQSLDDYVESEMASGPIDEAAIERITRTRVEVEKLVLARRGAKEVIKESAPGRVGAAGKAAQSELDDLKAAQADWVLGAKNGLDEYSRKVSDVASATASAFKNGLKSMEDELVNFVMTGQLNFSNFANSVINDLVRIAIQKSIMQPFSSFLGGLFADGGAFGAGGVQMFANGGAFTNSIVSSPTLFKFANGTGLMGEAGPEAIMPLTRGPDGRLGVTAAGGGGANVVVNVIESPSRGGQTERRSENGTDVLDVFVEKVKSSIANDISRGAGSVPSAMTQTYGLNRVAGAY